MTQLQAALRDTIKQLNGGTSEAPGTDGSFTMRAKQAEQIEEVHSQTAFSHTVGGELAHVAAENDRLSMDPVEASKQLDAGIIATLHKEIAELRGERSAV